MRSGLAALAAAAVLAGAALASNVATPETAFAEGPLPACRYDDILTSPRAYDAWSETLVDTILRVSRSYVPPDLVSVNAAGISGVGQVRALVIPDLAAMTDAAKANGTPIGIQSAYRSYTTQVATFQSWVNLSGYKQALLFSARPGHSEHQLGLAIDFKSAAGGPPWSGSDWGTSPAGSWMRQHAWEYGFIQSYPKGKLKKTCYDYEAWHFRYVGRDEAAAIHASGLTLREYLWIHYTTAIVPPVPSVSSTPSTTPSARPRATAASAGPTAAPATSEPSLLEPGGATTSPGGPGDSGAADTPPAAGGGAPGSLPPGAPAGAVSGMDPGVAAAGGALLVALVALVASLGLARRRSAAMGQKGGSGAGLPG